MAAEHTFKLLLAETKKSTGTNKRPRGDDQVPPEAAEPKKAPKPKRGAGKAKSKPAAWKNSYTF